MPGFTAMRKRPTGAGSSRHSGTRKKRRPTSMGCNRSRADCTQSRASSSRCRAPGKSSRSAARFASSSKKDRTVCGLSSTMPAEPCSHSSAMSRSRSSGSQSISRENMFQPSPFVPGAILGLHPIGITPDMKLQGIFPPITTPFDYNGNIYLSKIQHNVEKWNLTTLSGYVWMGSTDLRHEATRYFPTNHYPIRLQRKHLPLQDPAQRGEVEPHHTLRLRRDGLHRRERDADAG